MKLLTNEDIEKKLLRRVRLKATAHGREPLFQHYHCCEEGCSAATSIASAEDATVIAAVDAVSKERTQEENCNKVCHLTIESVCKDIIVSLIKIIEISYFLNLCIKKPPKVRATNVISDE